MSGRYDWDEREIELISLFQIGPMPVKRRCESGVPEECDPEFPADQGHGIEATHGECDRRRAKVQPFRVEADQQLLLQQKVNTIPLLIYV